MPFKKHLTLLFCCLCIFNYSRAQIEVAYVVAKDFNAIGYGGSLNFSFPVQEVNYITIDAGVQYFQNSVGEDVAFVPVLVGYRYTLNQTGLGFYVEPNAGYSYGVSSIDNYDEEGYYLGGQKKVSGPSAGFGFGYLFELGNIPFNVGLRLVHNFGNTPTNIAAFRISHSFGRRRSD